MYFFLYGAVWQGIFSISIIKSVKLSSTRTKTKNNTIIYIHKGLDIMEISSGKLPLSPKAGKILLITLVCLFSIVDVGKPVFHTIQWFSCPKVTAEITSVYKGNDEDNTTRYTVSYEYADSKYEAHIDKPFYCLKKVGNTVSIKVKTDSPWIVYYPRNDIDRLFCFAVPSIVAMYLIYFSGFKSKKFDLRGNKNV